MSKVLEPWQQRVVEEFEQLDARLEKLQNFLSTDQFLNLGVLERDRLYRQHAAMRIYKAVLYERLVDFNHGS